VEHSLRYGRLETEVREFSISVMSPWGGVVIDYVRANHRKDTGQGRHCAVPDNLTFLTVECEHGAVLYDSRLDVPCDLNNPGRSAPMPIGPNF
jgi:hypothetical protein